MVHPKCYNRNSNLLIVKSTADKILVGINYEEQCCWKQRYDDIIDRLHSFCREKDRIALGAGSFRPPEKVRLIRDIQAFWGIDMLNDGIPTRSITRIALI